MIIGLLPIAYGYELEVWKWKIIYNPLVTEEITPTFIETHVFDDYVNLYNMDETITKSVSRLGYSRIGLLNTDNGYIYTIYLTADGKITKVVDGYDNVEFIAEVSISRVESLAYSNRFEDILQEVKVPFKVKVNALRLLW